MVTPNPLAIGNLDEGLHVWRITNGTTILEVWSGGGSVELYLSEKDVENLREWLILK